MNQMHEIDYKVFGDAMQFVELELDPNEAAIAEAGGMMYMDDAIAATINIMKAPVEQIKIRSSYNLAAISFTPTEIAAEIKKHIPELEVTYEPDFRQKIADSWPASIDDSQAREDWGWSHEFDLEMITVDMLKNLAPQYDINLK